MADLVQPSAGDESMQALRDELKTLTEYLSVKGVHELATQYGTNDKLFTDRALAKFIAGKDKGGSGSTSKANHDALQAVLRSPIGRAIRHMKGKSTIADGLILKLAGISRGPQGLRVDGQYFMYHGSYKLKAHYVIRYLSISKNPDQTFSVEDVVPGSTTHKGTNLNSTGIMRFADGRPQIVLHGDETKRGLSLMILHNLGDLEGELANAHGGIMVMNEKMQVHYRDCLIVRAKGMSREEMLAQAGIFKLSEIRGSRHAGAFETLRENMDSEGQQSFADPMCEWPRTVA